MEKNEANRPLKQQYNRIWTHMPSNNKGKPSFIGLESKFHGSIGTRIVHLRRTSSTMDDARELVQRAKNADELHGTVIIADEQTRGRGRFDRSWDSEPSEDILTSIIVCPRPSISGQLTIMASLGVALAVETLTDSIVEIKWPNDVLVDGKKVCGVIAEGSMMMDTFAGILGIGLNVNMRTTADDSRDYQATSLRELVGSDGAIDRVAILNVLLEKLNEVYDAVDRGEAIMPEWRGRLKMLGSEISVSMGAKNSVGDVISGVAEDVDEFGRLLIRESSGTLRAVASGEVTTRVSCGDG